MVIFSEQICRHSAKLQIRSHAALRNFFGTLMLKAVQNAFLWTSFRFFHGMPAIVSMMLAPLPSLPSLTVSIATDAVSVLMVALSISLASDNSFAFDDFFFTGDDDGFDGDRRGGTALFWSAAAAAVVVVFAASESAKLGSAKKISKD